MNLTFELADGPQEVYQALDMSCPTHPQVVDKLEPKKKFFWWLRGSKRRPRKFDKLNPLHRKFEWRRDFYKPLSVLFYPQARLNHCCSLKCNFGFAHQPSCHP